MQDPLIIRDVTVHPLRAVLPVVQRTGQGAWPTLEIVVVEVTTESGRVGIGECLARRGALGYAAFMAAALTPVLLRRSAHDRRALWRDLRGVLTGRPGGMLIEAVAGIDIALWDLAGQAAGEPIWRLLGGMGRRTVVAYASSVNWAETGRMEAELDGCLRRGFRQVKLKIGHPIGEAIAWIRRARALAGPAIELSVDANWVYDADDALRVGRVLADEGFQWLEEPLPPDDHAGYRRLARHLPIRLAAGESDFVARQSAELVAEHVLGLVQPDVARSGGITETWRIAEHAAVHGVAYAPHVGWSGGICAAASLHLAAAAENFLTFECMVFDNPLRQALTRPLLGDVTCLENGGLPVPQAPGLGVALDRDALAALRITE